MRATLIEMEVFLRGKFLPGDILVNETNAEYLVRKFTELEQKLAESQREFRAADATIENLQMQVEKLAAENTGMKEWSPNPHSASMFEAIEKAEELMDDGMPELAMIEAFEILKMKRTTATDAFMAEVRAQGVEMAACALDDVNQFNYANMLDDLAQKLRQDANTSELEAAGIITKVGGGRG